MSKLPAPSTSLVVPPPVRTGYEPKPSSTRVVVGSYERLTTTGLDEQGSRDVGTELYELEENSKHHESDKTAISMR